MNNKNFHSNSHSNPNPNLTNLSNSSNSSSRPSSGTATTTTTSACASCKYQRRKCNPDCNLAPYFPADHQRQFLNAHRLFGVSNIIKIIRGLDPHRRSEAMKSIIFQSNARANDPVGGCYRIILDLERQLEHDCTELALVCNHLQLYKSQAGAHQAQHENLIDNDVGVAAADNDAALYGNNLMLQQQQQQQQVQQQQQSFDYFYFDNGGGGSGGGDTNENIGENNIENNNNEISISSGSVNNNNVIIGINNNINNNGMNEVVGPVEDVKPLVDMFDMTHALAIGEEDDEAAVAVAATVAGESPHRKAVAGSYQYCSTEVQSKEEPNPMEHVQEHDLKGAASLFTLTSRNSSYV